MSAPAVEILVNACVSPEVRLPESQPLTLTRNFAWVVAFCIGSLLLVPVAIAWTASIFLN